MGDTSGNISHGVWGDWLSLNVKGLSNNKLTHMRSKPGCSRVIPAGGSSQELAEKGSYIEAEALAERLACRISNLAVGVQGPAPLPLRWAMGQHRAGAQMREVGGLATVVILATERP